MKIDNLESASDVLPIEQFEIQMITSVEPLSSVCIGFSSIGYNSGLLVLSDYEIENTPKDNYTSPLKYFRNEKFI